MSVLQDYEKNAQGFVDTAMTAKFGDENTWTGKQHFNGGLTFSNNAQGDTLVANTVAGDLTITESATLPVNTNFGAFKADQIMYSYKLANGYSSMLRNNTAAANNSGNWNKSWWL